MKSWYSDHQDLIFQSLLNANSPLNLNPLLLLSKRRRRNRLLPIHLHQNLYFTICPRFIVTKGKADLNFSLCTLNSMNTNHLIYNPTKLCRMTETIKFLANEITASPHTHFIDQYGFLSFSFDNSLWESDFHNDPPSDNVLLYK